MSHDETASRTSSIRGSRTQIQTWVLLFLGGALFSAALFLGTDIFKQVPRTALSSRPSDTEVESSASQPATATGTFVSQTSEREAVEPRANERIATKDCSEATLVVGEMPTEDQHRLLYVNRILREEGLEPIAETARIRSEELAAFRDAVDETKASVDKAEDAWFDAARPMLSKRSKDLLDNILAGVTHGLPERSAKNTSKRKHPHEAISIVSYAGKEYILRLHPDEDPGLRRAGRDLQYECVMRSQAYDSIVRELFAAR